MFYSYKIYKFAQKNEIIIMENETWVDIAVRKFWQKKSKKYRFYFFIFNNLITFVKKKKLNINLYPRWFTNHKIPFLLVYH